MINASKDSDTTSTSMDSQGHADYEAACSQSAKEKIEHDPTLTKILEQQEVEAASLALPVPLDKERGKRNISVCDDEISGPTRASPKQLLAKLSDVAMKTGEHILHIKATSNDKNDSRGGQRSINSPRLRYEETGERTDAQNLIDHYDKIMALQRKMDAAKASLHQTLTGKPSDLSSRSNSQIFQEDTVVDEPHVKKKNKTEKDHFFINTTNESNSNSHDQHSNKRRRQATKWVSKGRAGTPVPKETKAFNGGC